MGVSCAVEILKTEDVKESLWCKTESTLEEVCSVFNSLFTLAEAYRDDVCMLF